jgi:hypothetical protein
MPGVVLGIEITDDSGIKLLRGQFAQMKKEALREIAEHFHQEMVPRRFTPGNDARYQHEKRNQVYKDKIKKRFGTGQGKYVNLQLSGKSKRRAALAKITGTQHQATLTVETPTYFRRPFVGTFRDEKGRQKRVTRQPDKVAEMLHITDGEKRQLRGKAAEIMLAKLKSPPARKSRRTVIQG